MSDKQGDFVWYELMTTDADAAQSFYGPLLGWSFGEADFGGNGYRSFSAGTAPIGGFLPLTDAMTAEGARPAWLGYIRVDDVDRSLDDIAARGGTKLMGPAEVPDVGPFAMVADPDGAAFYIIEDHSGVPSEAFARHAPREGHCAWNELVTADPEGAKTFYSGLFGWQKTDEMDMGEMGKYEMLGTGDYSLGAVMPKPAEMPVSAWVYYLRVPEIDAASAYVNANGGQVIMGPQEIPGGEYIIQGMDPQGAMFALIGKKG